MNPPMNPLHGPAIEPPNEPPAQTRDESPNEPLTSRLSPKFKNFIENCKTNAKPTKSTIYARGLAKCSFFCKLLGYGPVNGPDQPHASQPNSNVQHSPTYMHKLNQPSPASSNEIH